MNNLPQVSCSRGTDLNGSFERAGGIGGLLGRIDHRLFAIGDPRASAYFVADGNGNITCLVNSNEVVVARYNYDPFGNLIGMGGSMAEANLYRFSSKELHPNSGLVYYLYRYYEASLQRWVNRDPMEGAESLPDGPNLHRFVRNSPADWIDSEGAQPSLSSPAGQAIVADAEAAAAAVTGTGRVLAPVRPIPVPVPIPNPNETPKPQQPKQNPKPKPPPSSKSPNKSPCPTNPNPETDTCDKIQDWPDPSTGRRFCIYHCRKTGITFTKEGTECDINRRIILVKEYR